MWLRMAMMAAALAVAAPAVAQLGPGLGLNSDALLTAVRDGDGSKIASLVQGNNPGLVNRRGADGATALTLAVERRNLDFVRFLIGNGANPEISGKGGTPPLVIAAQIGWGEGVEVLLGSGAKVDTANRQGETALILAVQTRKLAIVRRLLEAGADPDRTDHAAGLSAREYARRDNRVRELSRMIDAVPKGGFSRKSAS